MQNFIFFFFQSDSLLLPKKKRLYLQFLLKFSWRLLLKNILLKMRTIEKYFNNNKPLLMNKHK